MAHLESMPTLVQQGELLSSRLQEVKQSGALPTASEAGEILKEILQVCPPAFGNLIELEKIFLAAGQMRKETPLKCK
jgi:hypothetical protein